MLLAIDPSSTCIGYALFAEDGRLAEFGRLVPRTKDGPMQRIADLMHDLEDLWNEHRPRAVVIEVTSGKVGKRHGGGGAGLAVYGVAVGAAWQLLRSLVGPQNVQAVPENEWTGGVPKAKRLQLLALEVPRYAALLNRNGDPGGDAGDAIGLGEWCLARRRTEAAVAGGTGGGA